MKREDILGRILGLGAGLAYGVSSVMIKEGVSRLAAPVVGSAVSLLAGTLVLASLGARHLSRTHLGQNKRSIVFLLLAGVASGLGVTSNYFALSLAPVVIVSPLLSTNPLFTLLWSHLFLGRLERITPKLVAGVVLVVLGVILVMLGREV